MNTKCKNCGAPLKKEDSVCNYCYSFNPYEKKNNNNTMKKNNSKSIYILKVILTYIFLNILLFLFIYFIYGFVIGNWDLTTYNLCQKGNLIGTWFLLSLITNFVGSMGYWLR